MRGTRSALPQRRHILLLLAVVLGFNLGVFPLAASRIDAQSRGVLPLDLRCGYSPDTAHAVMSAYGADGRRAYLWTELTVDVLYPVAYALFLSLSVAYLFERARPGSAVARHATVVPFAALVADYAENVGIIAMLLRYPQRSDTLVRLTSVVTCVKWVLFVAAIGLLVIAIAVFGVARARSRTAS
jgi:hypothetical protein